VKLAIMNEILMVAKRACTILVDNSKSFTEVFGIASLQVGNRIRVNSPDRHAGGNKYAVVGSEQRTLPTERFAK
jgi:hypothetical protein